MREFFSNIYCEKLVELLEVNPQKYRGAQRLGTLAFLTLRVVLIKPPPIQQLGSGSHSSFCWWVSEALTTCGYLSVSPVLKAEVCPVSSPCYGCRESCWFFSLISFLLVVRMKWQLRSSLPAALETWSTDRIFLHRGDIPAGYSGSASAELHFSMPFRSFQDKTHCPVYMISDTTIGMSKSLCLG